MSEVKLTKRYPLSRSEDIIDAYMRGEQYGRESVQAENAKLRANLREADRCRAIELEEIAKLRELLRDMWRGCPKYEPLCAECGHAVIDDSGEWPSYECDFLDRMDELGVWEDECK